MTKISLSSFAVIAMLVGMGSCTLTAQNMPTATGPGPYIDIGGGASIYQFDYGQRKLGGIMLYTDINPTWRYGLEGEVRSLRYHTDEDVTETTYLAGPRVTILPGRLGLT